MLGLDPATLILVGTVSRERVKTLQCSNFLVLALLCLFEVPVQHSTLIQDRASSSRTCRPLVYLEFSLWRAYDYRVTEM